MKYDIAIIGGGPAGMIAAISGAQNGAKVILIEKNSHLGTKLLLTGNGRCNLMNKTPDTRTFIEAFGVNGKFLHSSLHQFGVEETWNFFEKLNIPLKTEESNKVFPQSDKSLSVLNALIAEMKKLGVTIKLNSTVKKINLLKNKIKSVTLENKEKIEATNFILCGGGNSLPLTGSDGSSYALAQQTGHTVTEIYPGLTPLILDDKKIKTIEGVSLKNIQLTIADDKQKIAKVKGDIIFTANGISGPVAINASLKTAPLIHKKLNLILDLIPEMTNENLEKNIFTKLLNNPNKNLSLILNQYLPARLLKFLAEKIGLDLNQKCHEVESTTRWQLVDLFKKQTFRIDSVEGFNKAMITIGGVNLKEIEPKTLQSKIVPNLYFAGEILDLAGQTGGYNLQICWTTGFVAGLSATK
jgi:hypothetical protein